MKRSVVILTAMNFFFSSAFSVIIPLLMLERGIIVSEIGMVLALLPLIFITARLLFGYISDRIGYRHFFAMSAAFQTLSSLIYFFASSVTFFVIGKVVEGIQYASLWAVNRQALYERTKNKAHEFSRVLALGAIANAAGRLFAGFMIAYIAFTNTLLLMTVMSIFLFVPASFIIKKDRSERKSINIRNSLRTLDFRKRSGEFKKAAIVMGLNAAAFAVVIEFAIQVFLRQNSFSFEAIGIMLALFSVASGITTIYAHRMKFSREKLLSFQVFAALPAFLLLPLVEMRMLIWVFLLLLGIGEGFSRITWEHMIAKSVKESKYVGSDIGLVLLPTHIFRFLAFFSAGFVIQYYGFLPIFLASAALMLAYFIGIRRLV